MTIPRRVTQSGLSIVGSLLQLVFGTAADQPAAGDHDHTTTGVGASGATTTYRGGVARGVTKVDATPYTVQPGDHVILWRVAGNATITLPDPTTLQQLVIIDWARDAGTATKPLARHATENINGAAANFTLTTNGQHVAVVGDGTDWAIG